MYFVSCQKNKIHTYSIMVKKEITKEEAIELGKFFKINYDIVPFNQFWFGLNVELEHGTRDPQTNVTNDDMITTALITIAHLKEFPNYYEKLDLMEQELEKFWKGKTPNIFK